MVQYLALLGCFGCFYVCLFCASASLSLYFLVLFLLNVYIYSES